MKYLWGLLPPLVKAFAGIVAVLISLGFGTAVFLVTTVRSEVATAKSDLRTEINTARAQDMTYLRDQITEIKQRQDTMLGILLEHKK